MLKSNIGWSTQKDSFQASKMAAAKAVEDLFQTKVALVYTSSENDVDKVLEGAISEFGTAPIIGCTSSGGIIVPEGYISSEDGFVGTMAIGDSNTTVGVAGLPKMETARETGRKVAKLAMERAGREYAPNYFYMVANPAEEEDCLKGIEDIIGNVPFFGGSAADNTVSGNWKIFTNDGVFNEGVAVAFFYTDKLMANVYTGAYHETTKAGIITKLEGKRVLQEIDGMPALEKYAKWTEKDVKDLKGGNLLVESILEPLGVKDRLGDLIAIRHPMGGNEDLSINVGNHLAVNTAVIKMQATVDELIESTGKAVKEVNEQLQNQVGAYLLVHCGGRKLGIGDRIEEVVEQIKKETKGVPFMTIFTFGEYGSREHGVNTCGGLMLSFTGIGK